MRKCLRSMATRFLLAVCLSICAFTISAQEAQASNLSSVAGDIAIVKSDSTSLSNSVMPCARETTVLNTYRVYSGLLNGKAVTDVIYDRTYKSLSFDNSFVQKPSVCLDMTTVDYRGKYIPELGGTAVAGTIEYWKCVYKLI